MATLIVVDVQNDFTPGGALAVPHGDEVVPVINRIQGRFERVVATKDWHPPDHGSFAVNHGKRPGEVIILAGMEQVLWPVHCVQGTPGADLVPELDTGRIERVFTKGVDPDIDSYSCFFDNGHRRGTGLADFLREVGARRIAIAGLATDYCVRFSALDAIALGLETLVIEDACRGIDLHPGDVAKALDAMRTAGVRVVSSRDLSSDAA